MGFNLVDFGYDGVSGIGDLVALLGGFVLYKMLRFGFEWVG